MQAWIIATAAGIALGLLLYLCVRLRMWLGPIIRDRFGQWARRLYWIVTIAVMVVLANAGLLLVREWVGIDAANLLLLEIWFALLALGTAMSMIYRRIRRNA